MTILFYTTGAVALAAALMAITRRNAMHAILYLIVMLLAMAILFFMLGAPFVAAMEIIVYAGAIIVLFLFVIMMINPDVGSGPGGPSYATVGGASRPRRLSWFGPLVLVVILGIEWTFLLKNHGGSQLFHTVGPGEVGRVLFQEYYLGVQLVALFLLVGLIGAFHFGRQK